MRMVSQGNSQAWRLTALNGIASGECVSIKITGNFI
jgi:hypothetical protein